MNQIFSYTLASSQYNEILFQKDIIAFRHERKKIMQRLMLENTAVASQMSKKKSHHVKKIIQKSNNKCLISMLRDFSDIFQKLI